jgi:hypothetical protein
MHEMVQEIEMSKRNFKLLLEGKNTNLKGQLI